MRFLHQLLGLSEGRLDVTAEHDVGVDVSHDQQVQARSHAATIPPNMAPTARSKDHVVAESVFAIVVSSSRTTLGITAERAGSKNEAATVSSKSSG